MINNIYKYWFDNMDNNIYKRWIPLSNSDKKVSFQNISEFGGYLHEKIEFLKITSNEKQVIHYKTLLNNNLIGFREVLVDFIVLDQFLRTLIVDNIDLSLQKEYVTICLGKIIIDLHMNIIANLVSKSINIHGYEMVFLLMPLKHSLVYKGIDKDIVMDICHKFNEIYHRCEYFNKFYGDLCKKYYISKDIIPVLDNNVYEKNKISEYNIFEYLDKTFFEKVPSKFELEDIDAKVLEYVHIHLSPNDTICVSLSGGIDSMVLTYSLFKLKCMKLIDNNITTIHIQYGNRDDSVKEKEFVKIYTKHLFIDTYTHNIKYLKRSTCNRQLYESITRGIRYECYRNLINKKGVILLGHIKDDLIENIITNFSTNKHISNLKKFEYLENIEGVSIGRPLLDILKDDIFNYSKKYKIPYLLNTTPEWSNRGKFRNNFVHAFEEQYGKQGFDMIIRSAVDINSMSNVVNSMIVKPLLDKLIETDSMLLTDELINNRYIVYTIFEKYFHSKGISKASKKSINNILDNVPCKRLFKIKKHYNVCMYDYSLIINQEGI